MKLNYRRMGTGSPVLIVHGLFGMLDNWQTIGRHFSAHHDVVLADLRNHGRSPHSDEFSYDLMVADLAELIEDLQLGPCTVIGHSMGGKAAMRLALAHPALVSSLVVVDIAPKYYPPGHQEIIQALRTLDITSTSSRKEVEEALMQELGSLSVVRFLMKNLNRRDTGGFEYKMNFDVIADNYHEIQKAIEGPLAYSGPTLFVAGDRSGYIKAEDKPLIEGLFPGAEIVYVENSGHWVHAEQPAAFMQVVDDFIHS